MTDPFDDRRRGLRRVHVVTASVAAAGVLGTGAVALALVQADRASAAQSNSTTTTPQGSTGGGSSDDGGLSDDGGGLSDDGGGVTPPAQVPQQAPGGSGHASSGGS